MSDLRFDGRVVIVTGAGAGLGKSHALMFAARGAKVVVNDLGGGRHGEGKSSAAADAVIAEIKKAGGEAVANYDSVEDGAKIVQTAMDTWGRIDVVVNNAGILRDTSFQKMSQEDWDLIYRVHVLGGFRVTHAAWNVVGGMREKGYGRVIFTSSAAGIYGNFGQANYAMAKLGLVGLSNTLALEGKKRGINVNTIAPIAGSRLTETVLPPELLDSLKPEYVSPLVLWLAHEECADTGGLFEVGGGLFTKLRFQRTVGKTFKLGRPISPDQIKNAWSEISSFEKVTYPPDITSSMQPILSNLGTKSRGGNELIDVDEALSSDMPAVSNSYDERDVALYALGVGAAENPTDQKDLNLVYEMSGDGFHTLPTFAVVPAMRMIFDQAKAGVRGPGLNYGFERILHGEQLTEVRRPLPPKAKLTHKLKIKDIWDKGKNAVVVTSISTTDETGEELVYNELTSVVRGAGGWGGERGPTGDSNVPPGRAPDAIVTEKTHDNQALLYRLSGDINPLHVDPGFAKAFGFPKPILHGLCTFGFAARAVIKSFAPNGDPRFFKSIKVRFADSVFPGETLITEMWKESPTRILFQTKVKEREKVVISNAAIELYEAIPQPKAKGEKKAAATAAAPTSAEPISQDIFHAIGKYVEQNAELVGRVGIVYQFRLLGPDSVWTIDLKNGKGAVTNGANTAPECTLELSDADFMAMCTGKADAQKLYFGGKLKISGNVMASQKLEFLKKLDPNLVVQIARERAGGAAASTGDAGTGGPTAQEPTSSDIFGVIGDYVSQHPELVAKVQTVYLFKLTGPDSKWTLDLKNGKGGALEGDGVAPECTLELAESDFMDMVGGKADPQKLYFGGKMKISGNVMASQKLQELFKGLKPADAQKMLAERMGKGAPKPEAPKAAPVVGSAKKEEANASKIFAALAKRLGENKSLGAELGAGTVQFTVGGKSWLVSAAGVKDGADPKANATLTISDEHLTELVKGTRDARDMFMKGELRSDGDVRYAQKLGMLKGLV